MAKINVKEKHLEHAKHTERVSNYISKKSEFSDWIVITSFYSALHYVSHKIFPKKCQTNEGHKFDIKTIGEYRNAFSITKDKHTTLQLLVEEDIPEAAIDYTQLREMAQSARYTDHNVDRDLAKYAQECLKRIKKLCE
jgi:hypothetical protein